MIIYGAGMAGLLAAHMLRRHNPVVYEAAEKLPDNHGALLRFRSDAVARATNLPFKQVTVHKAISSKARPWLINTPDLAWSNMYSRKVTGEVMTRSILDLSSVQRYIAPPDFITALELGAKIVYSTRLEAGTLALQKLDGAQEIISTIPMPMLMDMVEWPKPNFKFLPIWSIRAKILEPAVDVYQTIYYPDAEEIFYRASITGDEIIVECTKVPPTTSGHIIGRVLKDFGIDAPLQINDLRVKYQQYGKILPIDERARKEFILYMSDEYKVYSVGRFATWRQILLDDVVEDIQFVERFITERASYSRHLHHVTGK